MRRSIFVLLLLVLSALGLRWLNRDPEWHLFVPSIVMASGLLILVLSLLFWAYHPLRKPWRQK